MSSGMGRGTLIINYLCFNGCKNLTFTALLYVG